MRRTRRSFALLLALAMIASLIPVATSPATAAALVGEGAYAPAESNIAVKYWVTASATSGNASAKLAIDGDYTTVWYAPDADAALTVNLGGTYDAVYKTKVAFAGDPGAYKYILEGSTDSAAWTTLADRSENTAVAGGFTDVFKFSDLNYLRLTIKSAAPVAISEFEIINYFRDDMNNGSDTSGFTTNTTYYNADGIPPAPDGVRNGGVMTGDPATDPSLSTGENFFGLTKDLGWDTIRLRIWNDPKSEGSGSPSQSCSPANTRLVAKYIKGAGQDLAIDFHYADSWSDPQNQPKPYAWANLPFESANPDEQDLIGATYDFTYEMIKSLIDQGTPPTIIALGNEISNGMMWGGEYDLVNPFADHHHYYNTYIQDHPDAPLGGGIEWLNYTAGKDDVNSPEYQAFLASITRLAKLVDAGQRAINRLNEEHGLNIETEMHFAFNVFERPPEGVPGVTGEKISVDPDEVLEKVQTLVFGLRDNLNALNADGKSGMTDRVGISYYPDWHGTYDNVQRNIVELSKELPGVKFNIAECSPRASGTVTNDGIGWMSNPNVVRNPMNDDPALPDEFTFTPQWQGDDTVNIMKMINDVPNNVGMGVWPWNGQSVYFTQRTTRVGMLAFKDSFATNVLESAVFADASGAATVAKPATVKSMSLLPDGTLTDVNVTWNAQPETESDIPGYAMFKGVADAAGNSKDVKLYVSNADGLVEGSARTVFYKTDAGEGRTLSTTDPKNLIAADGLVFKDLNANSVLDAYEDWRKPAEERAADLVAKLSAVNPAAAPGESISIDKIAPLMLASYHFGMFGPMSGDIDSSSSMQGSTARELVVKGLRSILNAGASTPTADQIAWNNAMQAVAEADANMFGIPVNVMSDPRSNAGATDGVYDGSTSTVSKWPGSLGFGATFNPDNVELFGKYASQEYRALGITTALSPQIDITTEPRWSRASGTYSESPELTSEIAAAYVKGFQSTYGAGDTVDWGSDSVAAMIKHWPGDGAGEGGRESHGNGGKYAVYPGSNLEDHIAPFAATIAEADKGKTTYASAVMPSYSIGIAADGSPLGGDSKQLGSGVSPFKMQQTLFNEMKFTGYVCTDWGVSGTISDAANGGITDAGGGMAWGTGDLPGAERVWAGLKVGVDMYGGLESPNAIKEAYKLAVTDLGRSAADAKFKNSVERILASYIRLNLFEDPYISVNESLKTVGSAEYNAAGYEVQLDSIVMLKNEGGVIAQAPVDGTMKTVYIPLKNNATAVDQTTVDLKSASLKWNVVTDSIVDGAIVRLADFTGVDFALVKVDSPANVSYSMFGSNIDPDKRNVPGDVEIPGSFGSSTPTQYAYRSTQPIDNGYNPKTLQYGAYYADPAVVRSKPIATDPAEEAQWIAAGQEAGKSRYYGGKTITSANADQLDLIINTAAAVGDIPIVVAVSANSAMIFNEFETKVDAIVVSFGTSDMAIVDTVSGAHEPVGLLPIQMPANMYTVERQQEDVPFDMTPHQDSAGNAYDFAFGLNWSGVISDARVAAYPSDGTQASAEPPAQDNATPPGTSGGSSSTSPGSSTSTTPSVNKPSTSTPEISYRPGAEEAVEVLLNLAGGSLRQITVDGSATLTPDVDYVIDGGKVTFSLDYLATLSPGEHVFTFVMSGGEDVTVTITIADEDTPESGADASTWDNPFLDVADTDWFYDAVGFAFENGLMVGVSEEPMLFDPNTQVTRAMVVTTLWRMAESPQAQADEDAVAFSDVLDDAWYFEPTLWAASSGIVVGNPDGTFAPDEIVTRQDLVTILDRYVDAIVGVELPAVNEAAVFADEQDIADYAKEAVAAFQIAGIVQGKPLDMFDPNGGATRAELATVLERLSAAAAAVSE